MERERDGVGVESRRKRAGYKDLDASIFRIQGIALDLDLISTRYIERFSLFFSIILFPGLFFFIYLFSICIKCQATKLQNPNIFNSFPNAPQTRRSMWMWVGETFVPILLLIFCLFYNFCFILIQLNLTHIFYRKMLITFFLPSKILSH